MDISRIKNSLKDTLLIRGFGLAKIPLIAFLWPKAIEITDKRCEIMIPLTYRSKNHLGSMYFGALSIGADLAVGLLAIKSIRKAKKPVKLIFKDFNAQFLKRAEGNVHFICEMGEAVDQLVQQAALSEERVEHKIKAHALVPSYDKVNPVALFELTLSLKL